ncbi:Ulp1 family isopeptidase [Paracidovorax avenae]|uniref:Ulp1 family isopeptidase n=1 Tax=Paracidovorax avenae TaxID=80867 RepID=UPI001863FCAB|nr:Ulp1 family isopeptidase [Paracidovorax avenae]
MDDFFSFDINSYRRMTAAMDEPHASPPSPRNDGNRTQSFHPHPLRDALGSLEIAHGPVQSSVHRMRAPAPGNKLPKNIAKLINILPRFGSGESWETLARDFPNLKQFMSDYGISDHPYIERALREIDQENFDYIIEQTEKRINILYSDEHRYLALKNLASKAAAIRSQPAGIKDSVHSQSFENENANYYKELITSLLKILDRFEAGEDFSLLKKSIPNIKSYLTDSGFTKHAKRFLEHVTPEEKKRFDRAFKQRSRVIKMQPSALTGSFAILQSNPEMLLSISKKFSNRSNPIEGGVCDEFMSPFNLKRIVNQETGELTPKGEQIISHANPAMQAAIRANFRLRFQAAPAIEHEPQAPSVHTGGAQPGSSIFSGFSEELRRKGYAQEPATPQHPPATPTFSDLASHPHPHHGQHYVPPGESLFSGFSGELQRRGYHPEPATPQYPPATPTFSDLASHPDPYYGQHYVPPGESIFSGVSGELQRMGQYHEPATPQYPPATPNFSDLASHPDPYYGQHYVPPGESLFSGFSGELQRRGHYHEPATPQYPQSPASTFGDLSSLNEGAYSAREFDLNTPAEVTQPWQGDAHDDVTPATSPERIDVDALPSPQEPSTPAARPSGPSETEWLGDEHLIAYMGAIADRLQGQPRAELLNFADPLLVAQLIRGNSEQRHNAMHQIMARGGPVIFLPVNDPNAHWSLLVIDQRNGDAFHYDSLVRPQNAAQAVDTNQYRLARAAAQAMGVYTPVRGTPIALQRDGHSCGDHVLQAMDVLAHSVINGTFGQPHTMDLSGIETDRGLIADTIANASSARTAEPAPAASRTYERPVKKSKKWWNF